jgi:hypothetical protein
VGGLILGQILAAMGIGEPGMATAEGAAPAAGGFDIGALIGQLVGGGAGGGGADPDHRRNQEHDAEVSPR